jgi:hypothetical protein
MRKAVTFLSLLAISSTGFAKNIECNITLTHASSGGLMPIEKAITLTQTNLQKSESLGLNQCSSNSVSDLKILFCGIEDSEAVGIFKVELLIEENSKLSSEEVGFTSAGSLLAISKKGGKLINLDSKSGLSPVFIKKMNAAKLDFPDYKGGDSLQIDDVVADAHKKGVLKDSDVVSVDFESCILK